MHTTFSSSDECLDVTSFRYNDAGTAWLLNGIALETDSRNLCTIHVTHYVQRSSEKQSMCGGTCDFACGGVVVVRAPKYAKPDS